MFAACGFCDDRKSALIFVMILLHAPPARTKLLSARTNPYQVMEYVPCYRSTDEIACYSRILKITREESHIEILQKGCGIV